VSEVKVIARLHRQLESIHAQAAVATYLLACKPVDWPAVEHSFKTIAGLTRDGAAARMAAEPEEADVCF
jgi:hypothetical protein